MLKAMAGALIGGMLGAGVWAAIGYFTHAEIGLIAVLVGALAGIGAKVGAGQDSSSQTGMLAVLVALVSIVLGKFLVAHFLVQAKFGPPQVVTPAMEQAFLAHAIAKKRMEEGANLQWPPGRSLEGAEALEDFPAEVVSEAQKAWEDIQPETRQTMLTEHQGRLDAYRSQKKWEADKRVFLASFGLFDVLWGVLAVRAAYRLGGEES